MGLMLAACMGPQDETLIAELRLVAMAAEPPQVAPGEPFNLTLTVADPLEEGGDLLVWSCVPDEPFPGLTELPPLPTGCVSQYLPLTAEQLEVPWVGVAPLPLWGIVCAPGLCGDLTDVPEDRLEDPFAWLQDLPVSGVSAGFRTTPVAVGDEGESPTNPALEVVPDLIEADPVEGAVLDFVAVGATSAYGYATAGGFSAASYEVASDGSVALTWLPPDPPTQTQLYVVFEDGLGGVSVWLGQGS